jgi:hypothetical protein
LAGLSGPRIWSPWPALGNIIHEDAGCGRVADGSSFGGVVSFVFADLITLTDADYVPTGSRVLDMLHEDLLLTDPTGLEGQDLFS